MAEIPRPQTNEELWYATYLITGIRIPRVAVCPEHRAPFDAFADAYFARYSLTIWKGSRGLAGKSLLLALLGYMEMIFLGANTAVLGGSLDQSKRVHDYQTFFWNHRNAPRQLLLTKPDAVEYTSLRNGGDITCLKASQTSVRGGHPQRLRLDEVDEMDRDIYDSAMGQTMESPLRSNGVKPQTVASSTHQHADGTMTYVLTLAAERGYPVYEWCYKESMQEWLTQEMVDTKRNEMTAEMWRTEVELGEPSIGNRAIDTGKVDAMFDAELGLYEGAPDEYIELEPPYLSPGYALQLKDGTTIPADEWAFSWDYTAPDLRISVVSTNSDNPQAAQVLTRFSRVVGHSSFVVDEGNEFFSRVDETVTRHWADWWPFDGEDRPVAAPVENVERRYATGADWAKERDWTIIATWRIDVVPRRLVAYLRIGRRPWPQMVRKLDERLHRYPGACMYDQTGIGNVVRDLLTVRANGFVLTGANEDSLLSEYISAVERGDYKCPRIRHPYSEHKLATMDAIYGSDHLPDTVCANALAHRAAKRSARRMLPA